MNLSIRTYCYDLSGNLLSVSNKLVMALHNREMAIAQFANNTIKFAELIVRLETKRPEAIVRESYYLLRFHSDGKPDAERFDREIVAAIELGSTPGDSSKPSKVTNHEHEFVLRGGRWTPTISEKMKILSVALGRRSVSRLSLGVQQQNGGYRDL